MSARAGLPRLPSLSWLLLYAVTLAVSLLAVLARAVLIVVIAYPTCLILGLPYGWIERDAFWIALAPLTWSAVTLIWPWEWLPRQQYGARTPSDREAAIISDAFDTLRLADPGMVLPYAVSIVDEDQLNAAVLGREVFVNRGVLQSRYLLPILAHELGHIAANDGVQSLALIRLAFFPALLNGRPAGHGIVAGVLRGLISAATGAFATRITVPIWGAHWRAQEYLADQYAARLGQGPELARFLAEEALIYDLPIPFVWMTDHSHPFVEERINRLNTGYIDQPDCQHA